MPSPSENRDRPDPGGQYGRTMERLAKKQYAAAMAIHMLTAIAVWPNRWNVALVVVLALGLVGFNMWVTSWLIPRRGPVVGETTRCFVNTAASLVIGHQSSWVAPLWLWIPYIALSYDSSAKRAKSIAIIGSWSITSAVALADGVSWLVPVSVGVMTYLCGVFTDARVSLIQEMFERSETQRTELDDAHHRLKEEVTARQRAEVELRQGQKLEAMGRLASGVAHEINNPLQYATSSVSFLEEGFAALIGLVDRWRERTRQTELAPDFENDASESGYDELRAEVAESLGMATDGLERVAAIVSSMKQLAHPEQEGTAPLDLNAAIEATLVVARHEYRFVADVETDLRALPPVECHGGAIGQVLLNLVVNAAHAIADRADKHRGTITVRSRLSGAEHVIVSIEDDGCGIPDAIRDRIFDPFFTTKAVGRGTGQGLAIARSIVVDRHGGTLVFQTAREHGTVFVMRLPVRGSNASTPTSVAA